MPAEHFRRSLRRPTCQSKRIFWKAVRKADKLAPRSREAPMKAMALALIIALATPARAQYPLDDGKTFLFYCSTQVHGSECAAFVRGAWMMYLGVAPVSEFNGYICAPKEISVGQIADILLKYIKDRPAERHHPTVELLVQAMRQSYPCQR
jgi:hypothetical protein